MCVRLRRCAQLDGGGRLAARRQADEALPGRRRSGRAVAGAVVAAADAPRARFQARVHALPARGALGVRRAGGAGADSDVATLRAALQVREAEAPCLVLRVADRADEAPHVTGTGPSRRVAPVARTQPRRAWGAGEGFLHTHLGGDVR